MAAQVPPHSIVSVWYPVIIPFAERISRAWQDSPFLITSWWRSPQHNLDVGGEEFSQHLIGTAADAVPYDGDMLKLERAFEREGLIGVVYDRHTHVQLLRAGTLERWARA